MRLAAAGVAALVGSGAATAVVPPPAGAAAKIPASAFSTHTGITPTTVKVGNISTQLETLFTGATVGTEAYAAYVDAKGGVNGRKLVVTSQNTNYSGTADAQLTQAAVTKDFALVGSFSVTATSAGQVLTKNPQMPDVAVTVSPTFNRLPNLFSPFPLQGGWQEGPLVYLKQKYPQGVKKIGELVADEPSAVDSWNGEKATMEHLGYGIAYDNTYPISAKYETFVTDVVAMKAKGVKMVFIEQIPPLYTAPLIKAINSQDFHPVIVLGAPSYSDTLIPTVGDTAIDGAYLSQEVTLYLGQDAKAVPAVATFLHWVQVARPGWKPTLFTLYGWVSAELFSEALKNAGKDPSRGSLLQALSKITTFTGTDIEAPVDPAAKTQSNCYLLGRVVNGQWSRLDDPPVSGKTHGFRCTNEYYLPPGAGS
jgi:ABC-type branched-subunit amino acid transport system substrate-binding protein